MGATDELPVPSDPRLARVLQASLGLLALSDRLVEHWNAHARAMGLSGTQVKLLLALVPDETATMRELARRLSYDASNLTTVVDRLQSRGLLDRVADTADRRSKPVRLTGDGERTRATFWHGLTADAGPLAPLTERDLGRLVELLAKLGVRPAD